MKQVVVIAAICACGGKHAPRDGRPPPARDAAAAAVAPEPTFAPPPFELPAPKDPIAALESDSRFGCVVRASGHVDCWDLAGKLARVPDVADAVAVAADERSRCIARRSEITCYDLGDVPRPPQHVALPGAVALAAGEPWCAIGGDGHLACWSRTAGDGKPKLVPEVRDATGVVSDDGLTMCATVRDGHVWCVNTGDDHPPPRWRRIKGLDDVRAIALNGGGDMPDNACAVRAGGRVSCFNIDARDAAVTYSKTYPVVTPAGLAKLQGATAIAMDSAPQVITALVGGHVVVAELWGDAEVLPVLADANAITADCARRAQGSVVCWGSRANGQPDTVDAHAPVPVLGVRDVVSIATSPDRSAAVTRDGRAFVWGGWLARARTHAVELPGSHDLASVAIEGRGNANPCFLHRGGSVTCLTWGEAKPVEMGVEHVSSLTGDGSYLTLTADGSVRECTDPIDGTTKALPAMPGAVEAVGAPRFVCARDAASHVSCAQPPEPATPVAIGAASALAIVLDDASNGMACAIAGGAVSCWKPGGEASPRAIALGGSAVELHGELREMCAKLADRSLACWGFDAAAPHVVLPPGSLDGPFAGGPDGCTIRKDGQVACWGGNGEGRLGDGSVVDLASPAAVPLF